MMSDLNTELFAGIFHFR